MLWLVKTLSFNILTQNFNKISLKIIYSDIIQKNFKALLLIWLLKLILVVKYFLNVSVLYYYIKVLNIGSVFPFDTLLF